MIYYITDDSSSERNATSKARMDIFDCLRAMGYTALPTRNCVKNDRGVIDKLKALIAVIQDWRTISSKPFKSGDTIILSYPLPVQAKAAGVSVSYIRRIREAGVHFVLLMHDLESVRFAGSYNNDRRCVDIADAVIVHNASMASIVRSWTSVPVIKLGIFDYFIEGELPPCKEGIDVAGNLSPEKAGWIYRAGKEIPDLKLNLYGVGCEGREEVGRWYRGSYPPDDLPSHMDGLFGLVWDGDALETCSGGYGDYLRVNSPHKLSLYLALGKPVFIWAQAAQASFVREHELGFAVESVYEAWDLYQGIDAEKYQYVRNNALRMSGQLRSGLHTKGAILSAIDAASKAAS